MQVSELFYGLGARIERANEASILDLQTQDVIDQFTRNGIVYFSGFGVTTETFEEFTGRFTSDYMDHRGGGALREVINKDGDKTILSVSYAYKPEKGAFDDEAQETFPLALHADRSYTTSQPPLMWFLCVQPAAEKGETTVCDGVAIYDGLQPSTKAFFESKKIKYIRTYKDGEWQLWSQCDNLDDVRAYCRENELTMHVNADGSVTTEFVKSAIVVPRWSQQRAFVNSLLLVQWQEDTFHSQRSIVRMEDGSVIPPDILAEVREVSDGLTRCVPWRPGDVVMLDNTRMLHGRRPFNDTHRKIFVRMARSVPF
jgi:alpha-ketoglutarate-dependent taurine dioxygenase